MGCNSSAPQKEKVREQRVKAFKEFEPRCLAEIDLENLKWNISYLQRGDPQLMPVLSNDAYGHGAVRCAELACSLDVNAFAVSNLKEGIELREGGITPDLARIIVLGEPMRMELAVYSGLALGIVVSCRRTAENLCEWAELYEGRRRLLAYVLVDTGYTGIGIPSRDVVKCVTQLTKPKVKRSLKFCGLMLRTTDDRVDQDYRVEYSLNLFRDIFNQLKAKDIKVPAMILEKHQSSLDEWDQISRKFGEYLEDTKVFARCGTETFGFKSQATEIPLRRCMSLKAQVRDIRKVYRGEWIGLGEGWQAPIDCFVAVIACGFADGFPSVSDTSQISVRINNESYTVVGQVHMDQILVRIGSPKNVPTVSVGDYAILFGPQTQDPENEDFLTLAKVSGLPPTSLLCHLSARLAKRWKSTQLTRRNTLTRLSQSKGQKPQNKQK